jgi:hypothetical protein
MTSKFELIEELRRVDEVTLLELLGITSDELVDAFLDKIEDNVGRLTRYIHDN